ncbi:MAG: hypothetical protein ACM3JG_13200 [Thiohalocapsa sp.]
MQLRVFQTGLWAAAVALAAMAQAHAQVPPPVVPVAPLPPGPAGEAADIASCLCLGQTVNTLNAEMASQQGAYHASQDELARLDAQLATARASLDVNNPAAVAQFRELLGRRDAAFRRSTSLATGTLNSVVGRYNARVNEYNARCANHPRDPVLLRSVQATLVCPPAY